MKKPGLKNVDVKAELLSPFLRLFIFPAKPVILFMYDYGKRERREPAKKE